MTTGKNKMTKETIKENTRIFTIEEAIARSIPCDVHHTLRSNSLRELIKDKPLYFGLGNGSDRLHYLKNLYKIEEPEFELLDKSIELKVDGGDYLSTFRRLLNSPETIRKYTQLLNPLVREEIAKGKGRDEDENFFWIRSLFGIADHSAVEAYFTEFSQELNEEKLREDFVAKANFVPEIYDNGRFYAIYKGCLDYLVEDKGIIDNLPNLGIYGYGAFRMSERDLPKNFSKKVRIPFESSLLIPYEGKDSSRYDICLEGIEKAIEWMHSLSPKEVIFTPGDGVAILPTFQQKRTSAEGEKLLHLEGGIKR